QKPVEAMALGRLVIASDLPALREAVSSEDGRLNADLFAPGDARGLASSIAEAFVTRGAVHEQVKSGLQAGGERTWPALVQRYGTIYRDALEQHIQEEPSRGH